MRILALDLGTHTGWACWNGARRESGVIAAVRAMDRALGEIEGYAVATHSRPISGGDFAEIARMARAARLKR